MSELQIFKNAEFGSIRTLKINGEPYFVGRDVAEILGYSNSRKALADHVDEEDKGVTKCDTLGGTQEMTVINESGLYSLILLSKLPTARKFKRWVTSEVLPTIRRHGVYAKGEVLLTIMASLAQQESESLSKNVKLGLQFRYQNGEVQVNHNRFMGYTKDDDGNLVIEPREAEIVKRIYLEYLQGASLKQIGDGLERDGILTAAGKPRWRPESVKKILTNEKYIGDALLQKTYTIDVLTKKRVKNNGLVPQYYVENNHEAIIPRELYAQVQEEILRRANLHSGKDRKKRVYSSKYALSSICYCSKCGDIYRRTAWNNRGKKHNVWRCVNRIERGPDICDAPTVEEEELKAAVVRAINQILGGKDEMLETLEENIRTVLALGDDNSLESINERMEKLQKELLKTANAHKDYSDLADEIDRLREQKQNLMTKSAEREGFKQRIAEMQQFLAEQTENIEEYDEALVRRMVEKITVFEDKFTVEFKSSTSVDVAR